jgi:hypothetical protein
MFIKVKKAEEIETADLYVPYEYKEQAKNLGAKWNRARVKWTTAKDNPNYQKLVDIFHTRNFHTSYQGEHMNSTISTEKQRINDQKQHNDEYNREYKKFKDNILKTREWTNEDQNNFGEWWCVHTGKSLD